VEGGAARRRTVAVSGHLGDETAARAGLQDPSPEVRATALGALARMGGLKEDEVAAGLADPSPRARRRAGHPVGRLHLVPSSAALTAALADPDPGVVEAACYALGELDEIGGDKSPDSAAIGALGATASAHPDPLCREAAIAALGSLGSQAGLPAVLAALQD